MGNRILSRATAVAIAVGILSSATAAGAQWTEADVIARARRQAPPVLVARARAALARARVSAEGLYPDPIVEATREQTFGAAAEEQTYVTATLPIDLSGRRAVARELARTDAAEADADAALAENAAVTAALIAFYDVLIAERRLALATEAAAALEETARVLSHRAEQGAASGYDQARIGLEAELARTVIAEARWTGDAARLLLAAVLDLEGPAPALDGSLDTDAPPPLDSLIRRALRQSAIERARQATGAARGATDAAGTSWIPVIELTGGVRLDGRDDARAGYVAGVGLEIPIFSGARGAPEVARARLRAAQLDAASIEQHVRTEVGRAYERLLATRAALSQFTEAARPRIDLVRRGAAAGYREGTRSVLELLDAERAALDARLRQLSLEAQAKVAEIQLRGAVGRW